MALLSATGHVKFRGSTRKVLMLGNIQQIEGGYAWKVSIAKLPRMCLAIGEVELRREAIENIELFFSLYGWDIQEGQSY